MLYDARPQACPPPALTLPFAMWMVLYRAHWRKWHGYRALRPEPQSGAFPRQSVSNTASSSRAFCTLRRYCALCTSCAAWRTQVRRWVAISKPMRPTLATLARYFCLFVMCHFALMGVAEWVPLATSCVQLIAHDSHPQAWASCGRGALGALVSWEQACRTLYSPA